MNESGKAKPPAILYFILKFLTRTDMQSYILGDFDENYFEIAETSGKSQANNWYLKHFILSLPKILFESLKWKMDIFKNYMVVALRNMKRQKVFTLINVFGLSIALMICIWIFMFIKDELSFDRFHENRDSLYSVVKTDYRHQSKRRFIEAHTGPALKEYFPEIKHFTRIAHYDVIVQNENNIFEERCDFVDDDFLNMFTFKLLKGDARNVLESESSVILTETLVKKYFDHQDPIGKTLTIFFGQIQKDFIVTGIAENVPSNSFIQFKMLMNISELYTIYGPLEWGNQNWTLASTYIQLHEDFSPDTIEARLPNFFVQNFGPIIEVRKNQGSWEKDDPSITLGLQNIKDIYFHSQGIESYEVSHVSRSYILAGIGFLILFIACINFTNLSIGRASTRTIEIGMRKIIGAERKNLIQQFLSESVIIVSLSMFIGLMAGMLLLPLFNRLSSKNILESDLLTIPNLAIFGVMVGIVGLLAGLYPGSVLSRIQPIKIIRGTFKLSRKNLLTRLLIFIQFSVSIFLVISTFTMSKQLKFILTKDLGYDREGIVIIKTFESRSFEINDQIYKIFKNETENLPYVTSVSGCVFPLSSEIGSGRLEFNNIYREFDFTSVHYDFFETMGIEFIAGGDFPKQHSSDVTPLIVTETFIKAYEINDPIGKAITESPPAWQIVGVVKDFNFWNLKQKIKPTVIVFDQRNGPRNILVRINTSNISQALASLETIWKKSQPNKPFVYSFEDEIFKEKYLEEKRWNNIVFYSSFFSILITAMGLIGITTLTTSRRFKEIGIRKVLGAPVRKIFNLLTGEYLILVALSNLITWPLGYYFMNKWLNNYAYRINIDLGIFILTGLMTLVISITTIGILVYKTASSNPVTSLRYE